MNANQYWFEVKQCFMVLMPASSVSSSFNLEKQNLETVQSCQSRITFCLIFPRRLFDKKRPEPGSGAWWLSARLSPVIHQAGYWKYIWWHWNCISWINVSDWWGWIWIDRSWLMPCLYQLSDLYMSYGGRSVWSASYISIRALDAKVLEYNIWREHC